MKTQLITPLLLILGYITGPCLLAQEYTCFTRSSGQEFERTAMWEHVAYNAVITDCKRKRFTYDSDCERNAYCPGANHFIKNKTRLRLEQERTVCRTKSQELSFKSNPLPTIDARFAALKKCFDNPYTDKDECQENLTCD